MNIYKEKTNSRGFVILFSMLISSLILLMSVGIFNVVQKQLVLGSYGRESQRAFYAADSALECALYWDVSDAVLAGSGTAFVPGSATVSTISCNEKSIAVNPLTQSTAKFRAPFVFRYPGETATDPCAYVLVEKNRTNPTSIPEAAQITAIGFNSCLQGSSGNYDTPNLNDPRLLERRISIGYVTTP